MRRPHEGMRPVIGDGPLRDTPPILHSFRKRDPVIYTGASHPRTRGTSSPVGCVARFLLNPEAALSEKKDSGNIQLHKKLLTAMRNPIQQDLLCCRPGVKVGHNQRFGWKKKY
ncbi:hypothetical protein AVEN_83131-1 [Araneus ventricosus]|uniref:Uncharacterized protein n=1 Tax=Araneus ventricosus TaxID=182803 RepID=A0A4Y2APA8_ARAVE|nr:hypothetical protein AVEN_83131-1 [Araneus ventricosus]